MTWPARAHRAVGGIPARRGLPTAETVSRPSLGLELPPDLVEELNRAGGEAGVVVVEVGVNDPLQVEQTADFGNPGFHLALAVDDDLVPVLGFFFDALAVAEKTQVAELGGVQIEPLHQLVNGRHPGMVNQRQGDLVFAQ